MKRLQNFYLYSYRTLGFIFLVGLIASIGWYGFSVLFFLANTNWATPFILSANQKNVFAHQEHFLNVQQQLLRNTVELITAKEALHNKKIVLENALKMQLRIGKSMQQQAEHDSANSKMYHALTQEKASHATELNKLAAEIHVKESAVRKELRLGLITKEEALAQQLLLTNLRSALIEAKVRTHELKQRALDFNAAALTLNGAAISLPAMEKVIKKVELARQTMQLKSDIYALTITVRHLKEMIKKRNEVVTSSQTSPYILATKSPIQVAFVPYRNLSHVTVGAPIYSCYFDMILCYQSGQVTKIYPAEEYGRHPIFKSEMKGQFIGITLTQAKDAQKNILFFDYKPLLI